MSHGNSSEEGVSKGTVSQFVGYFLWLGTVGFGGPIALAGHMQQDLVEDRGWIRKEDYLEGLALAQLAPGPLAAQLAVYLGYIRAGVLGATAVGIAFVLPSFVMVLAVSAAYVRFGGLPWMQGMFYGIGAAVIGIIARSAFKLTKLTVEMIGYCGHICGFSNIYCLDIERDRMAVSAWGNTESGGQGMARPLVGTKHYAVDLCIAAARSGYQTRPASRNLPLLCEGRIFRFWQRTRGRAFSLWRSCAGTSLDY
jgi:chromate transport protein ChrA